ncbi:MAG TPA: helix-turn-helix domain-containing protein [Pirellulales bacterium]|jgi:excisionase family DNA binding protein|nr:helix-turn-helix domain-containing protein [Pirellulales bacterium]
MSRKSPRLQKSEIARGVEQGRIQFVAPTADLAKFLGVPRKTIYRWIADGRLKGCYRTRGKRHFFLTDRVLDVLFNGPEWK